MSLIFRDGIYATKCNISYLYFGYNSIHSIDHVDFKAFHAFPVTFYPPPLLYRINHDVNHI